ncbi:zinc finger protein 260-like [Thalassophryne amazonica]|uniref:zinc finger protein 260-like n=1 Tax=Thalassophryne amazonica TaxID=390379 RepID=UPI00147112D0|nr:zinc finger protein 260-like [Thalassophryne amazonica]
MQQLLVSKEDILEQQGWKPDLVQNDSEPSNIKEKQEELWISQEDKHHGQGEAHITKFPFTIVSVKREDEEKPQSSQLDQNEIDERTEVELHASNSLEHRALKIEPIGDDRGGSQAAGSSGPCRHLQPHTDDVQHLLLMKEEILPEQQKWNLSFDKKGTKKEQEKLWKSQQGAQLHQVEEANITKFPFTFIAVTLETEIDDKKPSSQVHHSQSDASTEAEPVASSSTVHKTLTSEADGEDYGGPQSARNSDPNSCQQETTACGSDSSETETDDSHDCKQTRDLSSVFNCLKSSHVSVNPSSCDIAKIQHSCTGHRKICGHMNYSKQHRGRQANEKPFNCPVWCKRWRQNKQLMIHKGDKPFGCSHCGKQFGQKDYLTRHMRIHTGEKPFGCSECGKRFGQKGSLTRHMRIHTGEKPFGCSECGKRFRQKDNLSRHMIIHAEQNPFGCSECGKRFGQKGDLNKHLRIHAEQNPFGCSECGKRFGYRTSLMSHMIIHTGKKPFGCSECGKRFVYRSSLHSHKVSHTEKKPFGCSECGKEFGHKSNLITHLRLHSGKKPFGCSECGRRFTQKGNLKTHMKIHRGK